jgi:N-hydroxyarylamine O-acetyltransferase
MRMVTMPTREGRITLTDSHLKIASNGQISEQPVGNDNEFNSLLREYFDLELDLIRP